MTGNTLSLISNRVSYIFDLKGPSLTIDTACSSSLVALDYAAQDLKSGRIDTAIVGGVNALLSPFNFMGFCAASMLSPDGLCRPFDHRGNGYVRAEGGVVMILQREDAATVPASKSYGSIIASGMNADGRTSGVALPSSDQQAALLETLYETFEIDPNHLAFVEAHGTGTLVGDPAEAGALGRTLGQRRRAPLPSGPQNPTSATSSPPPASSAFSKPNSPSNTASCRAPCTLKSSTRISPSTTSTSPSQPTPSPSKPRPPPHCAPASTILVSAAPMCMWSSKPPRNPPVQWGRKQTPRHRSTSTAPTATPPPATS